VHVIDQSGRTRTTARLANDGLTVGKFFKSLGERCAAVLEAGWNWGVMYDCLAAIDNLQQVELAHPFWVRAIAAAQVKTDAIDAHTLAQLLALQRDPTRLHTGSRDPTPARNRSPTGISGAGANHG
jgi:hypothetical protein